MRWLIRRPALGLAGPRVWCATLWGLSSLHSAGPRIDVHHIGWRFRLHADSPDWRRILGASLLAMALVGAVDEWHQCYTPGRSGGDPWDWTADVLGGAAGAWILRAIHRRI